MTVQWAPHPSAHIQYVRPHYTQNNNTSANKMKDTIVQNPWGKCYNTIQYNTIETNNYYIIETTIHYNTIETSYSDMYTLSHYKTSDSDMYTLQYNRN